MELIRKLTRNRRGKHGGWLGIPASKTPFTVRAWEFSFGLGLSLCLLITTLPGIAHGDELADLRAQKNLTPEALLHNFAGFTYELGDRVQDADTFLQRKRGDCDDFASLASTLLTERGYKTKLVVIMMAQQTHVVCYVKEAGGFLDFNRRNQAKPLVLSDGTLEDIAQKVAASFRSHWRMASEVKYEHRTPVYLDSVFAFAPAPPKKTPSPTALTSANNPVLATVPATLSMVK